MKAGASEQRLTIRVGDRFDLPLAVLGHGWWNLPPNQWEERRAVFRTAVLLDGSSVDLEVRGGPPRLGVRATAGRPFDGEGGRAIRIALRRMLRLDEDLSEFWRLCAGTPRLRWVARRGAGRLLRAPTLFEDLLKLLFTTNCTWAATRRMTERTVDALGVRAPSGARAFPSAQACAAQPERFWREVVRAGYRASACRALSRGFCDGALAEIRFADPELSTDEVRRRLRALPGFGPYAAGQALRLLGRYDDLALDSWCRAKLGSLRGRTRPPSDSAIEREYRSFGPWAGLALWMDVTADWHRRRGRAPSW